METETVEIICGICAKFIFNKGIKANQWGKESVSAKKSAKITGYIYEGKTLEIYFI